MGHGEGQVEVCEDSSVYVPGNWPEWTDVASKEELAEWGFTYVGTADHVR